MKFRHNYQKLLLIGVICTLSTSAFAQAITASIIRKPIKETGYSGNGAASDYIHLYQRYLSGARGSRCAMYPSCSEYGLMAFEKRPFIEAMTMTADRMIRCGHDFDCYDLTVQDGQVRMLDLPPYLPVPKHYVYTPTEYYAYTDWKEKQDTALLFINKLINMHRYREALFEIERMQYVRSSVPVQLFVNKLICYKGLGWEEEAIYDYEMHFPLFAKQAPDVAFEMTDLLFQMGNYMMAQLLLGEVTVDDNLVNARKSAWKGILFACEENWNAANHAFDLLAQYVPDVSRDKKNMDLIQEAMNFRRKKPWLSASLSVVPGLGYLYTGRPKSALTSLVMNALLGYGVYTCIKKENYGVAALLGGVNLSFYIGNISGAKRSAQRYNQQKLESIQSALYKNNQFIY